MNEKATTFTSSLLLNMAGMSPKLGDVALLNMETLNLREFVGVG
jgi:hypothetical protein